MAAYRGHGWTRKSRKPSSKAAKSTVVASSSTTHTPDNESAGSSSAAASSQLELPGSMDVHQGESSNTGSLRDVPTLVRPFLDGPGKFKFPRRSAPPDAINGDFWDICSIHSSSDGDGDQDDSGHAPLQDDSRQVQLESDPVDGLPIASHKRKASVTLTPTENKQQKQGPAKSNSPSHPSTPPVQNAQLSAGSTGASVPHQLGTPMAGPSVPQSTGDDAARLAKATLDYATTETSSATKSHVKTVQKAALGQQSSNAPEQTSSLQSSSKEAHEGQLARAWEMVNTRRELDRKNQQIRYLTSENERLTGAGFNMGAQLAEKQDLADKHNEMKAQRDDFKDKYTNLISDFKDLGGEYTQLREEHNVLKKEHSELKREQINWGMWHMNEVTARKKIQELEEKVKSQDEKIQAYEKSDHHAGTD